MRDVCAFAQRSCDVLRCRRACLHGDGDGNGLDVQLEVGKIACVWRWRNRRTATEGTTSVFIACKLALSLQR